MASVQPGEIPAYQQPFSQVLTALGADARRPTRPGGCTEFRRGAERLIAGRD